MSAYETASVHETAVFCTPLPTADSQKGSIFGNVRVGMDNGLTAFWKAGDDNRHYAGLPLSFQKWLAGDLPSAPPL